MSYVDALKINDTIHVVERIDGKRIFQSSPAKYVFYVKNPKGDCTSIYGDPLLKYESSSYAEFKKEMATVPESNIFESDINPVVRYLEKHYYGAEAPDLHVAFFDIEVDFVPEKGFASPDDPIGKVTAISVYQSWTKKCITLVIKPDTLSFEQAEAITVKFPDCVLCKTEEELFERTFDALEDADVLSGWNSTTFDIPYLVRRLEKISHKEKTKKFCLWNQFPRKRTFEMFGREQITYDLYGRVHLDYLDLYKKNTYHEMHSYKLDNVGEYEVGEKKVAYEGTLDQLYNEDFEKFIDYNIQDVLLLVKIDQKLKFIELSNQLAHENTVLISATLGSVALIEQAIVNEIHSKGLVAPKKKRVSSEETSVAGAFVADPKKGMHDWVGSIDINSLYPSVIRSLNISPETIIGQLKLERTHQRIRELMAAGGKTYTLTDAWSEFFGVTEFNMILDQSDDIVVANLEDGSVITQSGSDWYDTIYLSESNIAISANGTMFSTEQVGIIPGLLARWYDERVELKGEAKKAKKRAADESLSKEERAAAKKQADFYDKRQLIKKILLNSLYGAILNPHCRFFDQRLGQSVTLTGRCITRHMAAKINECFTQTYDYQGSCVIYGDTDSAYFSAVPEFKNTIEWSKDQVAELYDAASDVVNESFTGFMMKTFNTTKDGGEIIQAGREVLASKGIFIKKKRYALLCYDIEGQRMDLDGKPGKIKAMGVEIKRSDTPKRIQDFLESVLIKALQGDQQDDVKEYVQEFREEFRSWHGWEKGTPKAVNGLTKKVELEKKLGKVNMSGHQRASMNWNTLRRMNSDRYSLEIQDGFKVIVCKLKDNPLSFTSIAYPVDQDHLPDWFKELPFNHTEMEEALIDKKLNNILGVLNWDFKSPENDTTFSSLFK